MEEPTRDSPLNQGPQLVQLPAKELGQLVPFLPALALLPTCSSGRSRSMSACWCKCASPPMGSHEEITGGKDLAWGVRGAGGASCAYLGEGGLLTLAIQAAQR
jgi:hypothetical protein